MSFVIEPNSLSSVVAQNLARLVADRFEGNQTHAAKAWGMHQRTLGRVINGEQGAALSTIEAVAAGCGLQPWHLLVADIDFDRPPALYHQTPEETELYERLRTAAEAFSALKK